MGLGYSVGGDETVTAAGGDTTIWEIDPAADYDVILTGFSFDVTSELQEAQEEWLRMRVTRYIGGTLTSANGTAKTPRPIEEGNTQAFRGAVEYNGTTIASYTGGTTQILGYFGVPVRGGYGPIWIPPEYRWDVRGVSNSALVIDMLNTLADDITLVSTLWLEEG